MKDNKEIIDDPAIFIERLGISGDTMVELDDDKGSMYLHDILEWYLKEALQTKDTQMKEGIDKLAEFIMSEIPGEPSESEGAIDCAIRIMKSHQGEMKEIVDGMPTKDCDCSGDEIDEHGDTENCEGYGYHIDEVKAYQTKVRQQYNLK